MFDNSKEARKVGTSTPRPNDLKVVGKQLFPRASTSRRLEAIARLMGFGSAAAYQTAVAGHEEGKRFMLPAGEPIADEVFLDVLGSREMPPTSLEDIVGEAVDALQVIGYVGFGSFLPTLSPVNNFGGLRRIPPSWSALGHELEFPYQFNEMICEDIQFLIHDGGPRFSEEIFSGDPGRGRCDRLWISGRSDSAGGSWAHPLLEAALRRAVRNPDLVEWMVEDSVRRDKAFDSVRCERESADFVPLGSMTPSDIDQTIMEEVSIVRPYLESMAAWLHETSPTWVVPEKARAFLSALRPASMSLKQARETVDGLRRQGEIGEVLMAELVGLSQCALPLGPQGGLPLPDFCLAAGLGLLANPASVDRPSPDELEAAVRMASEGEGLCDAYLELVLEPQIVDVLAREIAVSRERGLRALSVRIAMSMG